MILRTCDIVVIGGGPAGIAAAQTAASSGASVIMVDEGESLGGHYYKELPPQFSGTEPAQRRKILRELDKHRDSIQGRVEIIHSARVWGIFDGEETTFRETLDLDDKARTEDDRTYTVYAEDPSNRTISIQAQALILAPGVYDRSLPFPGWEFPGVMTPGAAQILLKTQGILPGKRIIVAGTGPLQMTVAAALVEAGAEVKALLDTCGLFEGIGELPSALGGLASRLGEGFHSLRVLGAKGVPILFRHAVFSALGTPETGVEGVLVGSVDPEGHPIPGSEKHWDVDTICCAYGFIPSIELTLHLGCKHRYNPNLWAWVPQYDTRMATSQPGIYVAGDVTGIGGKNLAEFQGKIAGISVLEQLDFLPTSEAELRRRKLSTFIRREERFSRWMWHRYRQRIGLLDLLEAETLVCRCEGVTYQDVQDSLVEGANDLFGVKLRTRMGMGSCQGRYCMMNAAVLISQGTGNPVDSIGLQSVRPPVAPTRLKSIASAQ